MHSICLGNTHGSAYSFVSYHNKLLLGHSFNTTLHLFTFVFWEINLVHTDPSMSDIKHSELTIYRTALHPMFFLISLHVTHVTSSHVTPES